MGAGADRAVRADIDGLTPPGAAALIGDRGSPDVRDPPDGLAWLEDDDLDLSVSLRAVGHELNVSGVAARLEPGGLLGGRRSSPHGAPPVGNVDFGVGLVAEVQPPGSR
jgi:hypothetical protein